MNLGIKLSILAFLIGFISLFLETISFTVTYFYVPESSHAAALVLSAFLCGIAASALAIRKGISDDYESMSRYFIYIVFGICIYSFCFYSVPSILGIFINVSNGLYSSPISSLVTIWAFLFIPGFIIGATFPLLIEMQKRFAEKYISVSTIYAIDVIGGTIGTLIAGFFMIPEFGIKSSLGIVVVVSVLSLLVAFTFISKNKKFLISGATMLIVFIGIYVLQHRQDIVFSININSNSVDSSISVDTNLPLSQNQKQNTSPEYIPYDSRFGEILFQRPSKFGYVTVGKVSYDEGYINRLFINYRAMCNSATHPGEKFIAKTASDNLREGGRVLSIGLGCGFTLEALTDSEIVGDIDLYEINSVIAENSTKYFFSEQENPLQDTRVNLIVEDGRVPLRESQEGTYDAIIIDVEEPGVIQSSPMYSLEYFEHVKRILPDDGIFALWAIRGTERYNKILYKTLREVFPHVYIVSDEFGSVQLFAGESEISVDGGVKYSAFELQEIPINLLYENALQDSYSIYKTFNLPEHFEDPFIQK